MTLQWPLVRRAAWRLVAALALAGCTSQPTAPSAPDLPPLPGDVALVTHKPGWAFSRFGVAAANPLATAAGLQILQAGGSAVDAAVAVQMVLTLVEPQSSGIGGGAFLLHWDGQAVQAWDGRETAPAAADERLFLGADGKPVPFQQAVVGGRSVGVPGAVRLLEAAHRAHGRLPWSQLLQPAIGLAERGFAVSARLHQQLAEEQALRSDPQARAYFYRADGSPHPVGTLLRNPALAAVLRRIAAEGSAALHTGPVADDIVRRVRGHVGAPGRLAAADLAGYAAKQREPLCTDWLASYRVCGMPPPSSGHLAIMQILGILERLPLLPDPLRGDQPGMRAGAPSADWLHAYTEAARLAFADRAQYVADPDFVDAPPGGWGSLLDDAYLQQRAGLVGERSLGRATPGTPGGTRSAWAPMADQPEHGTSHISIVDAQGRAVAMTTTIEAVFGSRLMSDGGTGLAGGFLLNNQLTDFALAPTDAQGRPVANRVQPGKRPRSSMSPTLVFDRRTGQLLMSLGSPGGPAIIHFTAKTLLGSLPWGLNAQQAIDLPNFGSFNGPTVLEAGRFAPATVAALKARGHTVVETDLPSGLQALQRTPTGWFGGADPRREGVVMGE
ncbi:gamma-glutamyltransferase family protein [Pseudaquabacterium pictum]|uniref:Gamma-glutamyltranspeptidase n=1 Tax=Pseudaquabacterium pictum TaxID=2315236 RepID=A0A480AV49_9BURK|nr:gamma-glutamyltransferase family protein [Rubrivivax pictus]GCL63665.1 gamma-glutamyltranspeptidase [Rubrivivax pictus]